MSGALRNRPTSALSHVPPRLRERNTPPYELASCALAPPTVMATIRSSSASRCTGASCFNRRPASVTPLHLSQFANRLPGSGFARLFAGRQGDFRHTSAVQGHPGILGDWIFVGIAQRLVGGDAVLMATSDFVALLVG